MNSMDSPNATLELEVEKLRLEKARHQSDIVKWVIIATGAVISFAVIDYGKLKLEQFRATSQNQRELLNSYLRATESPEPDVWKRKLHLILSSSSDSQTTKWAKRELDYIDNFAALDALYRETLKVASQLVEPSRINEPDRIQARARFNQLYWADLPFAGESPGVIDAMIGFRDQLIAAETSSSDTVQWEALNGKLIKLSQALRDATRLLQVSATTAKSSTSAESASP